MPVRRQTTIALCAAVALAACGENRETPATQAPPATSDPGPIHVHGLGENPKDGALFVATHTGMFRIERAGGRAERVADRFQDTMGFTVIGPDRFLGSGHPDGRDRLPPFLGLIESTDAGRTWRPRSLQGDADFHVLEARERFVYGFGADWESRASQLLVSEDEGRSWEERPAPEPLLSLAIDPSDPLRSVASGESSLHGSRDGGRTWRRVAGPAGLLSWPTADRLYLVDANGTVHMSTGGPNARFEKSGDVGGDPAAFEASGRDELYVALHDGTIKRSVDAGESWQVFYRPGRPG